MLLDVGGPGLPVVRHWGAQLGQAAEQLPEALWAGPLAQSALDVPVPLAIVPEPAAGWRGRPGLTGSRDGADFSPTFALRSVQPTGQPTGAGVVVAAEDTSAGLWLRSELLLEPSGVLRVRHALRNGGTAPYALSALSCTLPVPGQARELLDLAGRWCRERTPQRLPFDAQGAWVRETRHGRTGHDAPLVLTAGTPGFGFRSGEVWGVHLGWSGDTTTYAERVPDGRAVLGAGELLGPGEVLLDPGEEYVTPWLSAAYSGEGLDGISRAFHRCLRSRPHHPRSPRPVVLNTWEAVYFRHGLDELRELADAGARAGVERFVLDDGWFRRRRSDTAGLGDWYVDQQVWPQGLEPLIDHVRAAGMSFGLWVEPEMVNPDSDLYRAHPDWILRGQERVPPPWRHQQVLDLARPEVWSYLFGRLDELLTKLDISYLKWDHNRDLVAAGSAAAPAGGRRRAGVHAQTLAVYRLLDALRARHPGVEIESCSSGGARVDLGILERTDRVWASDTNDALERQSIQRWTGLLLPPELVGSHVGPPRAHTTGRTLDLSFRGATALFGHFGLEWDIRSAPAAEQQALPGLVAAYKRRRALLHSGDVVRSDHPDPAALVHGVVAPDRSEALFAWVQLTTPGVEVPAPACFPGLDPDLTYRVAPEEGIGAPFTVDAVPPAWLSAGGVAVDGRALATLGLPMPSLGPQQALVLHLQATGRTVEPGEPGGPPLP